MEKINLKKLLVNKTPGEILSEYMEGKINLKQHEIQSLINKKEGKEIGRGRALIGGKNG